MPVLDVSTRVLSGASREISRTRHALFFANGRRLDPCVERGLPVVRTATMIGDKQKNVTSMLVRCSECGKQISDKARTCPNGAFWGGKGTFEVNSFPLQLGMCRMTVRVSSDGDAAS